MDENLIVQENPPGEIPQLENLLINANQLNLLFKIAKAYAKSSMVPTTYQSNVDNCFIAVELAARMNVSCMFVMNNLYIVQGRPAWAGQACKALIDGCGKFINSEYIFVGVENSAEWGCFMQAVNKKTGKTIKGTTITWKMALDEGWVKKNGSKWKTFPEQMFKYRAAAFFARTECPEILMGYQTADEIEDINGARPEPEKVVLVMDDVEDN